VVKSTGDNFPDGGGLKQASGAGLAMPVCFELLGQGRLNMAR
jgi:hypothetical protein